MKDKETTDIKRKAESHFTKGNLRKALEEYAKIRELLPKDMRIVQKIADIQHKLGNLDEAKINYKMAAEYFTKEGYWAKAVALNKIIISMDPADKEVQNKIAEIYTSKGLSSQKMVLISQKQELKEVKKPDEEIVELREAEIIEQHGGESTVEERNWRIPLFSNLSCDALNELIEKLSVRRIPQGSVICKEGDRGDSMFVISEGWVEIFNKRSESGKITLDSLKEGDFFGEFGLLTDGKRHASAQAKSDVVLLEVTSKLFKDLSVKYPTVPKILEEYFRTRTFDNVLRRSKLFESLFTEERLNIIKKFKSANFEKGSYVFKEGDPGDRIYFIKNGEVEISVTLKGDQVVIARLSTGDLFGEISLLTGKPRTASVRAQTPVELLFLDLPSFKEILSSHPQIEQKLRKNMEERAKDTIEAYQSHEEMKRCLGMV